MKTCLWMTALMLLAVSGAPLDAAKLQASDGSAYDAFGRSASLSGSAGLVGAYRDDDNGNDSGSAYLFRNLDTATEDARLTASDGAASDFFGCSSSLSGSAGLVGAYGDGAYSGSAYLFRNLDTASGTVTEDVKLTASDGAAYDAFGRSASLSGSAGLVGAYGDGGYSGSAYLFRNLDTAAGTVTENVKLTASDGAASDYFGHSVSLSGSAGLIGAYQDDDNGDESGSAYLFRNLDTAAGTVTEDVKLTASDGAAYDAFGCSANLDGDRFLIGAQNGDGAVASSGKAYSGSVKSITTLNDGGASKTISGISFESRTDWIIGETTDDNAVTLSAGDAGDVTAVGKAVYIGKADTSDLNDLFLHGALTATAVYIGTMDGDGNEGNALWLAATADTSGVNNFYLSFGNMLKVESDVSDTGDLLTYLGSSNLKIWNGSTWETLAIGNASGLITTGFDGSYTSVRAIPEPATALLFGLGGISAWILRRERHLMQEV
ncbi:MAG: PEP-CTERM sorting domain-containing protein [Verrucomicrobia bacterium]|nr:PEP-CTERM sorting domain-containing protein [Verrucomicrobiota bacterium]